MAIYNPHDDDLQEGPRKTDVIFRVFPAGDVIAFFPGIAGTNDIRTCSSYQRIGQHSAADVQSASLYSRPAKPEQYQDLKAELESIGYDLNIVLRFTNKHREQRRAQL